MPEPIVLCPHGVNRKKSACDECEPPMFAVPEGAMPSTTIPACGATHPRGKTYRRGHERTTRFVRCNRPSGHDGEHICYDPAADKEERWPRIPAA